MIHDFGERLAFSQSEAHVKAVTEFLKREIPGCVDAVKTDITTDKKGIDYIVKLKGGAEIGVDEKMRDKGASKYWYYDEAELALETWSVYRSVLGWTFSTKTNVDYILYTFDPSDWDKAYLFPYQLLRMALHHNGEDWAEKFSIKLQTSNGWQSQAMFVPASVVVDAVAAEMQRGKL